MAGNPGLLCIDEAERFDNEKGSELRTILLGGYKAGNQAVRAERTTGGAFMNKRYETYGPKALGSINPLDPTLGSRTVVITMKPATRRIATFPFDSGRVVRRTQPALPLRHASHAGRVSHAEGVGGRLPSYALPLATAGRILPEAEIRPETTM